MLGAADDDVDLYLRSSRNMAVEPRRREAHPSKNEVGLKIRARLSATRCC